MGSLQEGGEWCDAHSRGGTEGQCAKSGKYNQNHGISGRLEHLMAYVKICDIVWYDLGMPIPVSDIHLLCPMNKCTMSLELTKHRPDRGTKSLVHGSPRATSTTGPTSKVIRKVGKTRQLTCSRWENSSSWMYHDIPMAAVQIGGKGNCLVGICFLQEMCYQSILPFCWRGPGFSTWIFRLEVLHASWSFFIETLGGAFLNANHRNSHLRPFKLRNNLWCARVSLGKPTVIAFGLWRRRWFIPWTPNENDRDLKPNKLESWRRYWLGF